MTEKTIDDGGYAFPIPADDKAGWHTESGMTLRDYFAGKVISNMDFRGETPERAAKWAYVVSDAMIKERSK